MYSIDQINEEKNEKKVVDVVPIKKGKRVLVFLADLFLCFLASFVFLNVMVMPIAQAATGFNAKKELQNKCLSMMHKILYENKVVLPFTGNDDDDIDANISYTFDCWLSYYVLDDEESPDPTHSQYGHKEDNRVLYNFFVDIRDNKDSYNRLFSYYNETKSYFELDSNDFILKESIKTELAPKFDPKVEVGSNIKKLYKSVKNSVFTPMLAEVFTDINKNDLTYEGNSYIKCHNVVTTVTNFYKSLLTITILIAYLLACLILYFVIPLINKNRKTIAMMMMHIERINVSRLYICKRRESISSSLYALFTNTLFIFILPISYVSFSFIFTLNIIWAFSILAILLVITSLIVLLFNAFNRTLSDIFSRSVLISTDKLDEIYRAKGYNV